MSKEGTAAVRFRATLLALQELLAKKTEGKQIVGIAHRVVHGGSFFREAIDPGVLLHLLAQGWSQEKIQHLLYSQSGLLGVSNISADMRTLRQSDLPDAALAIRLFTYRVIREIGAMTATLGGIGVLAFTGGIGEHDKQLREEVCQALGFLGLHIDKDKNNAATGADIAALHAETSSVEIYLIPTDEGRVAAQEAAKLLFARDPG